ncbi:MAG: U32 family peptidase [Proteobacteria bacterium]|nr:U32 family peptidase [Pseudomonadota bacterium]
MTRKIELLAPGGDVDSIKAAIAAGANAVYCGLYRFNARNRAVNISFEDINGILRLAHRNNCQVFLTLNIIIIESEIPAFIGLLNKLMNTSIDGIIVQDLGMLYLVSNYFKGLKIHASTQLTTHNEGQIKFLSKLSATRVNLSRELSINEIKALTLIAHKYNVLTEIFVHGSYCISFSGICYISSVLKGKSGNRGRCSQPCRDRYLTTPTGKIFPLNLKDNSAYSDLMEIFDAGVDSIKIEGRIKKFHYVYTVVNFWKEQLRNFYNHNKLNNGNSVLHKVFNRDFSNSYLKGDINKNMFIDNPRNNSAVHLSEVNGCSTEDNSEKAKKEIYYETAEIITNVKKIINQLSIEKAPLRISISGKSGNPLEVSVKTPDTSFVVLSETNLAHSGTYKLNLHRSDQRDDTKIISGNNSLAKKNKTRVAECLDYESLFRCLKALNDTEYYINHLELENLQNDLFLPFKELSAIKRRIIFILNGSKETVEPIAVPLIKKRSNTKNKPMLSLLISSQKDLYLCNETSADIYFQLPNCLKNDCSKFIDLFIKNKKLIPWFPSILIGEDYSAAIEFLQQVQPKYIVTNNTGIAYEACKEGISWIAGPYLNIVNSYSLLCLKEKFNCSGAFISNEINNYQIKAINKPDAFKLYYSIYHPILLITSRQCLFHQVVGCEKNRIDEECIQKCNKSASIKDLKKVSLFIEKTKGNYNCIYNNDNFLNAEIVTEIPNVFFSFFIDLRDIKTETKIEMDKPGIIRIFENLLNGNPESKKELKQFIYPSTNAQYKKGI